MNSHNFFKQLIEKRRDSPELVACMKETIDKLMSSETSVKKPGMFLGKIQSGKTRAFIGVIALAFDSGYDIAIVLTKGTTALTEQTYQRITKDFDNFIEDDEIQVFDSLHIPNNLTLFELQQKLVFVTKKETHNMKRALEALIKTYPNLRNKKVLIIDDEADFASISFRKSSEEGTIELGKIASQIDDLRGKVASSDFLQVTATPYSLYLQPDETNDESSMEFKPKRPSFTVLVPIYKSYIGGEYYFSDSKDEGSTAYYVYEEIPIEERETLKKEDRRTIKVEEEALITKTIMVIRRALLNFIVGSCIRRLQQLQQGEKEEKYSFIVHTEQAKASHRWQERIVNTLMEQLKDIVDKNRQLLFKLITESYNDLIKSVRLIDPSPPTLDQIQKKVLEALKGGLVMVTKVNSERETMELLDARGQLKLRTPMNIFIGGQILDRGLTIKNLVGFYYGRAPKRYQQDTVLQHSRMYGSRSKDDLAVTRFYTTHDNYEIMRRIHEFDSALREAIKRGAQDNGVYFIRKDVSNRLIPCSPNKLLLSKITTLKPFKRLLPVGFRTDYKTNIQKDLSRLDTIINNLSNGYKDPENPTLIDLHVAIDIIDIIQKTLVYTEEYSWDYKAFKSSLEYLSRNIDNNEQKNKVWLLVRRNRNMSRTKLDGGFSDAPDTPKTEGAIAKKTAIDIPILMLFRQNGLEEQGWRGSPFWWPVLMAPQNTKISIFASDTND